MYPKVSIIIVCRNAAHDLGKTLRAVVGMGYPSTELVVIDGLSTDDTPKVIERFRGNISYFVSERDTGLYDAMNKGIQASTGDYLWFVNAGDEPFESDTLATVFSDGEPLADIYFGQAMIVDQCGEPLGLRRKPLPEVLTWLSLRRGMVVCHQSFIVRRAIAPQYDLKWRYVADIDWVIECLKLSKDIRNTHIVLSKFAVGGISTRHRRASLMERFAVMRKHYGLRVTIWEHLKLLCGRFPL